MIFFHRNNQPSLHSFFLFIVNFGLASSKFCSPVWWNQAYYFRKEENSYPWQPKLPKHMNIFSKWCGGGSWKCQTLTGGQSRAPSVHAWYAKTDDFLLSLKLQMSRSQKLSSQNWSIWMLYTLTHFPDLQRENLK